MEQLQGLFRGFDFIDDNPIMLFLIIGAIVLLCMASNGRLECFFEQNDSLVWIILIVLLLFIFNNNNDCYDDDFCC